MTHPRLPFAAALCAAAMLAAAPPAAIAADAAGVHPATSPNQPQPRVGNYRIVSRGAHVIHAKCVEGGNVAVPTHEKATAAQRDRDIHAACKSIDYTK